MISCQSIHFIFSQILVTRKTMKEIKIHLIGGSKIEESFSNVDAFCLVFAMINPFNRYIRIVDFISAKTIIPKRNILYITIKEI